MKRFRFRYAFSLLLLALLLPGCSTSWEAASLPLNGGPERTADCEAKGLSWTTSRPLTWQQLQIHPNLVARPERVNVLLAADGRSVGYCTNGCGCRTNDWRRVENGRPDCPSGARPAGMCMPTDAIEAARPIEARAPAATRPVRTVEN